MGFTYAADLTQLLKESNIVSLHLNLTQWTSGMVNNDFLSKMRNDSLLVNTSHADLIKENDLWHQLDLKKSMWYACDQFKN